VPTTADIERTLRGVALRVTRPRVAALSAVHDHPHADTDLISVCYTACLTAADDWGYEITEAEDIYCSQCLKYIPANFCRIRRLIADTQRSTSAEQSIQPWIQSNQREEQHHEE
jgi:hypothetical protein